MLLVALALLVPAVLVPAVLVPGAAGAADGGLGPSSSTPRQSQQYPMCSHRLNPCFVRYSTDGEALYHAQAAEAPLNARLGQGSAQATQVSTEDVCKDMCVCAAGVCADTHVCGHVCRGMLRCVQAHAANYGRPPKHRPMHALDKAALKTLLCR